tara:strand:- start:132 stop:422 length:291 start_codon:yes stop_codon:yes gene_type:complete
LIKKISAKKVTKYNKSTFSSGFPKRLNTGDKNGNLSIKLLSIKIFIIGIIIPIPIVSKKTLKKIIIDIIESCFLWFLSNVLKNILIYLYINYLVDS